MCMVNLHPDQNKSGNVGGVFKWGESNFVFFPAIQVWARERMGRWTELNLTKSFFLTMIHAFNKNEDMEEKLIQLDKKTDTVNKQI